jgi:hypothetical protein
MSLSLPVAPRSRHLAAEIDAAVINALAVEIGTSPSVARAVHRMMLLERIADITACVEVSGSSHHTPVGDQGAPDTDAAANVESEDDGEETSADDEDGEADANPEWRALNDATANTKRYAYFDDGINAAMSAGVVEPAGEPFRKHKLSNEIRAYVRLTATGRALADKYIARQAGNYACRPSLAARGTFEEQVKAAVKSGHLKTR